VKIVTISAKREYKVYIRKQYTYLKNENENIFFHSYLNGSRKKHGVMIATNP